MIINKNSTNPILNTKMVRQETIKRSRNTKEVINKQNKSTIGCCSVIFKLLKIFAQAMLLISLLFYFDINSNNSIYTNKVKLELEKMGLLDATLHAIDYSQRSFNSAKNFLIAEVPLLYSKCTENVAYYSSNAWNCLGDYSSIGYTNSKEYACSYLIKAKNIIESKSLIDSLANFFNECWEYVWIGYTLIMDYIYVALAYFETELLGLNQGELALIFTDLLKSSFELLKNFYKWYHEVAQ